jgi:hypothetical protein
MQKEKSNMQHEAEGSLFAFFTLHFAFLKPAFPSPFHSPKAWPLKLILAVLFFGPLLAPLFQATGLPLLADSGALARDMLSHYICPTPAKSYALLGFPMAVCARCWGATIGLWAAWLLFRRLTADHRPPSSAWFRLFVARRPSFVVCRLLVGALPFALWPIEIAFWPAAPLWALLANGALAGLWAGLFFCSIWPRLKHS